MADAVRTVRAALAGDVLDVDVLERLAYDPARASEVCDELVPLLAKLLVVDPAAAQEVPSNLVSVLLKDRNMSQVLELTGAEVGSLKNPVVRPVLLEQLVEKAAAHLERDNGAETTEVILCRQAFELYAEESLDSASVSKIESLISVVPSLALEFLPFSILSTGSSVQRARLMDANIILLRSRTVPPSDFILGQLTSEDGDVLLAALECAYVGNLLDFFLKYPVLQQPVRQALYTLASSYRGALFLHDSIEATLQKCAVTVPSLFLEIDAQFLLVTAERPSLIAGIPATYLVKHHLAVVGELELKESTLAAIANIATDAIGLEHLRLSPSRVQNLSVPSQLRIAAAATTSEHGARLFERQYGKVLRNAIEVPRTQELAAYKDLLQHNLKRWGIYLAPAPAVATASS